MPSIGITVPVRVCDRCYNDMGGISTVSSSMASSFLAVDEDENTFGELTSKKDIADPSALSISMDQELPKPEERPERKREKRSVIVDDLANKIRASALSSS